MVSTLFYKTQNRYKTNSSKSLFKKLSIMRYLLITGGGFLNFVVIEVKKWYDRDVF